MVNIYLISRFSISDNKKKNSVVIGLNKGLYGVFQRQNRMVLVEMRGVEPRSKIGPAIAPTA